MSAGWLDSLGEVARMRLERAESSTRRIADGVADEWKKARQRLERAVDALREEDPDVSSREEVKSPPPPLPLPPTAGTWRAEESARWLEEAKKRPPCDVERPSPVAEARPAIEAATSRLRRTLMLQAAKRREEEEGEDDGMEGPDAATGSDGATDAVDAPPDCDAPAPPFGAPRARLGVRADELVYEDRWDEIETERTASAARQQAAAEARARELERELVATRRRLEEAAEAAAEARREATAASARAYRRPDPAAADVDEANLCVVCLEGERTHILIPCGHRCLCMSCAGRYEAHMQYDGSMRGVGEEEGELKKGRLGKKSKAFGFVAGVSSSLEPPKSSHACPLCRKAVTGVHLVWE